MDSSLTKHCMSQRHDLFLIIMSQPRYLLDFFVTNTCLNNQGANSKERTTQTALAGRMQNTLLTDNDGAFSLILFLIFALRSLLVFTQIRGHINMFFSLFSTTTTEKHVYLTKLVTPHKYRTAPCLPGRWFAIVVERGRQQTLYGRG